MGRCATTSPLFADHGDIVGPPGSCVGPVEIIIPEVLVHLRHEVAERAKRPTAESLVMKGGGRLMGAGARLGLAEQGRRAGRPAT